MLQFNFSLEYTKTGLFGLKIGNIYYGFGIKKAKISEKQSEKLLKDLVEVENDMAQSRFQMTNDRNTIYLGFLRIWYTQRMPVKLDVVDPYTREAKLEQKAEHYNDYKDREKRWTDRR